jgi:hypothetical protein
MDRGVPYTLVLPFEVATFTRDGLEVDRSVLLWTLERAAEVRIAGSYSRRNQALAEGARMLVAVWTRMAGGGTAETIGLARRAGTPIREVVLPPSAVSASAHGPGI